MGRPRKMGRILFGDDVMLRIWFHGSELRVDCGYGPMRDLGAVVGQSALSRCGESAQQGNLMAAHITAEVKAPVEDA